MNRSRLKSNRKKKLDETSIELNVIQNGRFSTILFMIGCFLNFIEYNYSERAILQSISNTEGDNLDFDDEIKAAEIAETVSIIFLIAMIIFTNNALTNFILQLDNSTFVIGSDPKTSDTNNKQGSRIIAFFDLIKVLGYAGAAIGYHIALEELKTSPKQKRY